MSLEAFKKELFLIKRELLELLKENKNVDKNDFKKIIELDKKIHYLYNRYLKIYVMFNYKTPVFDVNWRFLHSSCYYYALNLATPTIFEKIYKSLTDFDFESPLGSISGLPYLDTFKKEEVLNYLYSDLDALNIQWYDSEIDKKIEHGGYKIALLVDENPVDSDFHFVRQNLDGTWSEKDGCGCEVVSITTPEEFTSDLYYKYVKTLEIVKPRIRN